MNRYLAEDNNESINCLRLW